MRASENCVVVVKYFETCRLVAYPDPKTGGAPWTNGWGSTGPDVLPGVVWTQEYADQRFLQDLKEKEDDVNSLLMTDDITQGEFDALTSFAFNVGSDIDADTKAEGLGDSTLLRKFNQGDKEGARAEFAKWISPGSNVELGLKRRRRVEQGLFDGLIAFEALKFVKTVMR